MHVYHNTNPPFFAQNGDTPLLLAAGVGNIELVRMLLNEFSSSVDEVNDVSVYTPACSKYTTAWINMHNIRICNMFGISLCCICVLAIIH